MDKPEMPGPLEGAARSYAARILSESRLYPGDSVKPLLSNHPTLENTEDWDVVFSAEAELIKRLPDKELRRRAWLIYDRYGDVAGVEKAARRAAASASLKVDDGDIDLLRADLLQVHYETARHAMTSFQVERERTRLAGLVVIVGVIALVAFVMFIGWPFMQREVGVAAGAAINAAGLLLVGFGVFAYLRYRMNWNLMAVLVAGLLVAIIITASVLAWHERKSPKPPPPPTTQQKRLPDLPIVPMVILAGILGASFSILQRVQRSTAADPLVTLFNLRAARSQVYLSIISGAIASLVVFAIFGGGMLEGGLFPKIVNVKTKEKATAMMELVDYLQNTGPLTHFDYGKLLVWAFIAGFAERFVPDILDRFTASTKKT